MAEQYENDDDEFDTEDEKSSSLVRDLRKQLKAALKERDEAVTERDGLKGTVRERTVKDVLTAKGVRTGVAKYIPADVTDEAGVTKWLEDNAEDFGLDLSGAESESKQSDDEDTRARSLIERGSEPVSIDALNKLMEAAETPEQIEAVLAQAQKLQLS